MSWSNAGCKGLGSGAVGYWGRDIFRRVLAEQEQAKQRALLADQVFAGGIRTELWKGLVSGTQCACHKLTNQASDRKCMACHGTGYVPGYQKFGYNTLYMSAVDTGNVLTNVRVTTEFKSSKIELSPAALTGTIVSPDKPFTRSVATSVWAAQATTYVRIAGHSSVTVEFSTNSGTTWANVSTLSTANPTSGNIRFRATLTRDSVSILSPLFEIVRARYETIPYSHEQADGSYRGGPWILLMRSIPVARRTKNEHADLPMQDNLTAWTSGMSMFDPSITIGSTDELIRTDENMPFFFRIMDGVNAARRYVATTVAPSDPFSTIIVQQTFALRYADPVGPYSQVW